MTDWNVNSNPKIFQARFIEPRIIDGYFFEKNINY